MKGEAYVENILHEIGEDPFREGLLETPKRYLTFLKEFTCPTEPKMTTFQSEEYDEMVLVRDIYFYSLCEHHMLPFFGTASVAYIPKKRIVGLSKLARVVEFYSRRLQNQERITKQISSRIQKELNPKGVGVVLRARHLCMEMRGVRRPGAETVTSAMTGTFRTDDKARQEVLSL